jgi:uncharacterized UPF0146 family protein
VLQQHFEKPPLQWEPFTTARIRIAVALVVRHYRLHPDYFTYPPMAIYQLAELVRHELPSINLFSELVFCSKAVEAGIRLAELPWLPREQTMRKLHKSKVLVPRR